MKSLKDQNFYELLGVTRFATPEDIRKAYELSRQTFQENSLATYSLFSEEDNVEIMELINKAFETLSNPKLRRNYDDYLAREEKAPEHLREERVMAKVMSGDESGRVLSYDQEREEEKTPPKTVQTPQPEPVSEQSEITEPDENIEAFINTVEVYTGDVLKKVRLMRGTTLDQLADKTKIRKTYIKYIEDENYKGIPAEIYLKGFVRILSQHLGLPADKVLEDYLQRYKQRS